MRSSRPQAGVAQSYTEPTLPKQYPCHRRMAVRPGAARAVFTRKDKYFRGRLPLPHLVLASLETRCHSSRYANSLTRQGQFLSGSLRSQSPRALDSNTCRHRMLAAPSARRRCRPHSQVREPLPAVRGRRWRRCRSPPDPPFRSSGLTAAARLRHAGHRRRAGARTAGGRYRPRPTGRAPSMATGETSYPEETSTRR